ncbi:MAG: dipeptide/oligopeptide/nickel ABC transporter ATP-binding protein [Propioniciclava sp.]|uniref:ABC transporter ATP-binding protein n=1 Tax=Propioniciclava sp. TaxID=2038686 RepID=UPI0039E7225E
MTLSVTDLTFAYPGQPPILEGVSLEVAAGEIVGIRGRSGCGKSTLLKLLAGVLTPTAGTIAWQRQTRPEPGSVGMVFQDASGSLNPRWPIGRSVAEPLLRCSPAERRQRVRDALAAVRLADLDPRALPGQLSGGQCQRVAIARIHASRPRLLLADEPTSALDASVGAGIIRLLRELADQGTAIVLVSHDPAVLRVLSDRLFILDGGRLQEERI